MNALNETQSACSSPKVIFVTDLCVIVWPRRSYPLSTRNRSFCPTRSFWPNVGFPSAATLMANDAVTGNEGCFCLYLSRMPTALCGSKTPVDNSRYWLSDPSSNVITACDRPHAVMCFPSANMVALMR